MTRISAKPLFFNYLFYYSSEKVFVGILIFSQLKPFSNFRIKPIGLKGLFHFYYNLSAKSRVSLTAIINPFWEN